MKISVDLKNKLRKLIKDELNKTEEKCILKLAHSSSEKEVREILSKVADEKVSVKDVELVVDPDIIAGFIFIKGSTLYDYSLKSKILDQF